MTKAATGRSLSRRRFLGLGVRAALLSLAPGRWLFPNAALAGTAKRWSDRGTWGGKVPSRASVAVISTSVLLDVDATVAGVTIERGGELIFDPDRSRTLWSTGNVVIRGKLTMRPATPKTKHRLLFTGANESVFVGGGMDVLDSDVGLWVMDKGVLDIVGAPKLPWTRSAQDVSTGATTIELADDPTGWRVGDVIAITPTVGLGAQNHYEWYDSARIKAISERTVTLSVPTQFPHPMVQVQPGTTFGAEVLNLSRNVRIEGKPTGRAHIFIHSSRPQRIRHAAVRHMGPRRPDGSSTEGVPGRYGLHFHHCMDGSRGSVVEGVVIRECGSHAFVPHLSHGVTFRNCISHDTFDDAYWWDPPTDNEDQDSFALAIVFDRCVASLVRADPSSTPRLSGFTLGGLDGNVARGCVAVGVQGGPQSSGFEWPERGHGVWTFEDCLAHNNAFDGIFVWQNDRRGVHVISRFVGYHNMGTGIEHGAYVNLYHYEDVTLYGNGVGIGLPAVSFTSANPVRFDRVRVDGAGLADYAVQTRQHIAVTKIPTIFADCRFLGYRQHGVFVNTPPRGDGAVAPDVMEFRNCTFSGNELWLGDNISPDSTIRIVDATRDVTARRKDQPGTFKPEWNASVA